MQCTYLNLGVEKKCTMACFCLLPINNCILILGVQLIKRLAQLVTQKFVIQR